MKLIFQTAKVVGDEKNCLYPNRAEISCAEELQDAVKMDHVCAEYKGHYRSSDNFLSSDCIVMDCDNILDRTRKAARVFRPIVYICSPFAGDVERNVAAARRYCRYAVDKGCIPIAPHLLFPQFMDDNDPHEREMSLFFGNVLMGKCVEVWVFGRRISPGMRAEIERARRKNIRLRFFTEDCQEV